MDATVGQLKAKIMAHKVARVCETGIGWNYYYYSTVSLRCLNAIHCIKDSPGHLLLGFHCFYQAMSHIVTSVMSLEGGNDALIHGLGH